jgi:hypothetical protein
MNTITKTHMEHRDSPDRVVETTATVLCYQDWSMVFVLAGGAKKVYAKVFVVETVTVFPDYTVTKNDVRRLTNRMFPVKHLFPVKNLTTRNN